MKKVFELPQGLEDQTDIEAWLKIQIGIQKHIKDTRHGIAIKLNGNDPQVVSTSIKNLLLNPLLGHSQGYLYIGKASNENIESNLATGIDSIFKAKILKLLEDGSYIKILDSHIEQKRRRPKCNDDKGIAAKNILDILVSNILKDIQQNVPNVICPVLQKEHRAEIELLANKELLKPDYHITCRENGIFFSKTVIRKK